MRHNARHVLWGEWGSQGEASQDRYSFGAVNEGRVQVRDDLVDGGEGQLALTGEGPGEVAFVEAPGLLQGLAEGTAAGEGCE